MVRLKVHTFKLLRQIGTLQKYFAPEMV